MFIEIEKYEILLKSHHLLLHKCNDFEGKIFQLQHELDQLKKLIFGSKSERFIASQDPQQSVLPFVEQLALKAPETIKKTITVKVKRSKQAGNYNHNGRTPFPESLPRHVIEIEPEEDVEGCVCIGVEVTETLNLTPASLVVNRYERKKYARKSEGIAMGNLPERPIEKLMAETLLLVQIILDKYLDHLPLNRQIERYKRLGCEIPVSTMAGWIKAVSILLSPLLDVHQKRVLMAGYLMADETTIKVLDTDKKGKTHLGYYWVYYDPLGNQVLFVYEPGRGGLYPAEILKNFKGYLQSDGYAGYLQFEGREDIALLGCMAHARRKFVEAENNDKQRSAYVIKTISELYKLEAELKTQQADYEKIREVRIQKAKPILDELKGWLLKEISLVLPKSPIGVAINYTLQRFSKLEAYLQDGRLQIDNNAVERSLRPIAIGRNNYLFAGSHKAAERAATFYSLIGTCKAQGIDPVKYFTYVLNNIANYPVNKLEELLPEMMKNKL